MAWSNIFVTIIFGCQTTNNRVYLGMNNCNHSIHGTPCEQYKGHPGWHSHSNGGFQWDIVGGTLRTLENLTRAGAVDDRIRFLAKDLKDLALSDPDLYRAAISLCEKAVNDAEHGIDLSNYVLYEP